MSKATIHFVNGKSIHVTFKKLKWNRSNKTLTLHLENGNVLSLNWNNILYIEDEV